MNEKLQSFLTKNQGNTNAVEILQELQKEFGYLPVEHFKTISKTLGIPMVTLSGVATFYTQFSLTPKGKYTISMCRGTACHVKNSLKLLTHIEKKLKIKSGETTEDLRFTLLSVNCLGACAKAPAMIINETVYGDLTEKKIDQILGGLE